jgi:hypothetical protein
MPMPLRERPYQLFISYAHADGAFVSELTNWLTRVAGVRVWRDEERLPASSPVSHSLPAAVAKARASLFVLSRHSVRSGWVYEELDAAIGQRAQYPGYRVLALRLDDCDVPQLLKTTVYVTVPERKLTIDSVYRILCALHTDATTVSPRDAKDVYVSRSWRSSESEPADEICARLAEAGFRLVGDSTDRTRQERNERVRSIIRGCGALVAVAPLRRPGPDTEHGTSRYIIEEVEAARELGVPYLLAVDEGTSVPGELEAPAIDGRARRTAQLLDDPALMNEAVEAVREFYHQEHGSDYVFYAASLLDGENYRASSLVQAVTGMDCIMGQDLEGQHAQQEIIDRIGRARLVIADVTDDNLNTLIEAGVARGRGRQLKLVARGPRRQNRFMFRDLETHFYENEMELLGTLYRITHPYRRRILNDELRS